MPSTGKAYRDHDPARYIHLPDQRTRRRATSLVHPSSGVRLQVRHPADGVVVVQVAGELDLLTTPRLAAVLAPQVASTAEVIVLDLSQVDFLSTAALSHLLWARRHTAYRGQELRLVTGPPCVQRALAIVDLTGQGRFATYPALAAALSAPIAPTLHPGAARVAADPNKAT